MSPPVAARRGEIFSMDAGRSATDDACPMPGNHCTTARDRFRVALDYSGFGTVRYPWVPPQLSRSAAPPIRSDIIGDTVVSLLDRPRCGLTRLAPVSSPSLAQVGSWHAATGRGGRSRRHRPGRRCRVFAPFRLIPQHRPTTHEQFARQGDDRLLLARLAATEALVDSAGPGVVAQHDPGALD